MKRLLILTMFLSAIAAALLPAQGQAFNSGAHIYIVDRVFPFALNKINLYYGSIAPDISMYVEDPLDWPDAFDETHYDAIKLPYEWWNLTQKAFAKGWQTHNEKWGADKYAHILPGYVIERATTLVYILQPYNLDPELAHFAIETAIDILLVQNNDPLLGLKLLWAAKYRSQEDLELLIKTFVQDGFPPDAGTLIEAEAFFRNLVINYGAALTLPNPFRMEALGKLGAQIAEEFGVIISPDEVEYILRVAMTLCKEPGHHYLEVIRSAIKGISQNPDLIR